MKNVFKTTAALALVISVSVAACGGNKNSSGTDSASTGAKTDSTTVTKDTVKNDTTIKNDSTQKDTTIKVVTKTTTKTKKKQ